MGGAAAKRVEAYDLAPSACARIRVLAVMQRSVKVPHRIHAERVDNALPLLGQESVAVGAGRARGSAATYDGGVVHSTPAVHRHEQSHDRTLALGAAKRIDDSPLSIMRVAARLAARVSVLHHEQADSSGENRAPHPPWDRARGEERERGGKGGRGAKGESGRRRGGGQIRGWGRGVRQGEKRKRKEEGGRRTTYEHTHREKPKKRQKREEAMKVLLLLLPLLYRRTSARLSISLSRFYPSGLEVP
eukprot:scaffold7709_cov32-Tisochrysis_lutea.AAC.1